MTTQGESGGPVSIGQWIARAVAVLILIPIRLAWEGLKLLGRATVAAVLYFLTRLLAPLCTLLWRWVIRPCWHLAKDFLWDWVLRQMLWGLILTPALALVLDYVLRPSRRAVEEWLWRRVLRPAALWLWREVLRPSAGWLWRRVLRPVAEFVAATVAVLVDLLIVRPLRVLWRRVLPALWRWVLRPLWRALRATVRFGWRIAAVVIGALVVLPCAVAYRLVVRPLLGALGVVWHNLVTRPVRWLHRTVLTPMNRWASDIVTTVFGR